MWAPPFLAKYPELRWTNAPGILANSSNGVKMRAEWDRQLPPAKGHDFRVPTAKPTRPWVRLGDSPSQLDSSTFPATRATGPGDRSPGMLNNCGKSVPKTTAFFSRSLGRGIAGCQKNRGHGTSCSFVPSPRCDRFASFPRMTIKSVRNR